MLETFRDLFAFNAWANRLLFDACAALPPADYLKDLKSSHGGVHGTLRHLVWAEDLWLGRWMEEPAPPEPQGRDLADLAAVRQRWEEVEAKRRAWLDRFPETRVERTLAIRPTTGGVFQHTFADMFRHLINHSTYHRGQVVTIIRQVGATPPRTDLIQYYREQGR
ncbi:MAG: DinB family protein [Gemmatimonadales bacterium]